MSTAEDDKKALYTNKENINATLQQGDCFSLSLVQSHVDAYFIFIIASKAWSWPFTTFSSLYQGARTWKILQLSTSNIGLPDATCILFLLSSLCGTCSTCQGHPTHFFINNMNSVSHTLYISQFSCSVVTDSLQPHGLQHARLPCPSPTPRAYSDSCPLCW